MAGQFTTRRGAGGRLERIPEAEQGALRSAAEGIKPPIPDLPGAITKRDMDFQAENAGVEPPPLPPQAPPVQPPPLPQSQPPPLPPASQEEQEVGGAGAAAGGASIGGVVGPVGAAVGGFAAFAAAQSFKKHPIGSLEGGGQSGGGDQEVLRNLLEVTRTVARVGTPIKNAIVTNPANSRM